MRAVALDAVCEHAPFLRKRKVTRPAKTATLQVENAFISGCKEFICPFSLQSRNTLPTSHNACCSWAATSATPSAAKTTNPITSILRSRCSTTITRTCRTSISGGRTARRRRSSTPTPRSSPRARRATTHCPTISMCTASTRTAPRAWATNRSTPTRRTVNGSRRPPRRRLRTFAPWPRACSTWA